MDSDKLYRVQRKDLPQLEALLNRCFAHDPLYEALIPDADVRRRLMPELFRCDMDEFFSICEIFADSPELGGILVVSDRTESFPILRLLFTEAKAALMTDNYVIREDPSLATLGNFLRGEDYLNSAWTKELHDEKRLHIIYLAVDPARQHHGIAAELLNEVLAYADRHDCMISLETHNRKNLDFYRHFGFTVYEVVEKGLDLKQYCLVRERREQPALSCLQVSHGKN